MRKAVMFCLVVLSVTTLLFGCLAGERKSKAQSFEIGLEKVQKIEILSPVTNHSTITITDNHEINQFVEMIKVDDWNLEAVPSEAIKGKKFKLYQEETIHFDESSEEQKRLVEMATIILYEDEPYIDFSIKNNTFSFKLPKDVAEFLSEYD